MQSLPQQQMGIRDQIPTGWDREVWAVEDLSAGWFGRSFPSVLTEMVFYSLITWEQVPNPAPLKAVYSSNPIIKKIQNDWFWFSVVISSSPFPNQGVVDQLMHFRACQKSVTQNFSGCCSLLCPSKPSLFSGGSGKFQEQDFYKFQECTISPSPDFWCDVHICVHYTYN